MSGSAYSKLIRGVRIKFASTKETTMSGSAYSKLIRGVRIKFASTPAINRIDRFDSKTGNPKVVEEKSLRITAECQGVTIALPEEILLFSEVKNRYGSQDSWIRDRVLYRIYEWLDSFGIGIEESDTSKLMYMNHGDGAFIGCMIADVSSSSEDYVEVEEKLIPDFQNQIDDLLGKMFKCVKTYKTSVFLIASIS